MMKKKPQKTPLRVKSLKVVKDKIKETPINRIICESEPDNMLSDDDREDVIEFTRTKVTDSWEY